MPAGCESLNPGTKGWRPTRLEPAYWECYRRRWPIARVSIEQELLDLLERTCNGCIHIEFDLTESCEECGRRDICKDYQRLLELRGELNATARIET